VGLINPSQILVSAVKGIENETLMRMSEVLAAELHLSVEKIVVLSGPTIAAEVAESKPTLITAASKDSQNAKAVQEAFINEYFRVYTHSDVVGSEAGGSLKNVLAIAAGICDGLGYGYNTKAALITRVLKS